jgi:tetratricopeptide (TPR) repeat protein
MLARLFLLLILFTFLNSFFWDDEEKQLRQLHQSSEQAFQKGDIKEAKELYEELLGRITASHQKKNTSKYPVDWHTYVDVALRLVACLEELQEQQEAQQVLTTLLNRLPPTEFIPRIKLAKARLATMQDAPKEAYKEMRQLASHYPFELWPSKDLSFYHALEHTLNGYFDDLLAKAKRHLLAGFYPEAIALYKETLEAIEQGNYPKADTQASLLLKTVRYRLAECYYLAANYDASLDVCQADEKIDANLLYLSALCFKEKNEYEKAVEILESYTVLQQEELENYGAALFELGCYYYQRGHLDNARAKFEKIPFSSGKPNQLAALYLARILMEEKDFAAVEILLRKYEPTLEKDSLRYECYFLRGLAAYELGDFKKALIFFDASLAPSKTRWWRPTLYHSGWCHLNMSQAPRMSDEERLNHLQAAETLFQQILDSEAAYLSLAQVYWRCYDLSNKKEALQRLETLLTEKSITFSLEGQLQAFFLLADVAHTYKQKEKLYTQATDEKYKQAASYAEAWYRLAINYCKEGLDDPSRRSNFFELASSVLERAYREFETTDAPKAADILNLEAKLCLYCQSPINSICLLEKLLERFDASCEASEETYYLKGLLAACSNVHVCFSQAEHSFLKVIENYPKGKYRPHALYALAKLYYLNEKFQQAKVTYTRLATEYPHELLSAEAWFWAAEAAASLGENPTFYRTQVYEKYPKSEKAAESYFRQFPFVSYMQGESIAHLKGFEALFPDSPLLIVVKYLIGRHETSFFKATEAFEGAIACFSNFQQKEKAIAGSYQNFFNQSVLALATQHLSHPEGNLNRCEELLLSLTNEYKDTMPTSLQNNIKEEGELKLVECYFKQGKERQAQLLLQHMLNNYHAQGIEKGFYLSHVWQQQGKLAIKNADYDTAIACLELSLETGIGFLSEEEKLSLWLLQSEAYRGKKEYDIAMRFLSRVINAEAASPLRLKAMYLRAEIYELEGRPELAIRQLEATSKKGGEWAARAQEKLRLNYGLE